MNEPVSKLQYNTYEIGEFSDTSSRTIDELFEQIEQYPWQQQRDHLAISLTSPSITIEKGPGTYLKLAVYYAGKFVLHYLNLQHELYTKTFTTYQEAYPFIRAYYECDTFDCSGFRKENTWARNVVKHFVSQEFNYVVDRKRAFRFLLSTSALNFAFAIVMVPIFLTSGLRHQSLALNLFLSIMIFLLGGGLNLMYFFNFYFKAKGWRLIMSRGNDVFYYGPQAHPEQYDKKDIASVELHEDANGRSPLRGFTLVRIMFKNGLKLQIPGIVLNSDDLCMKLYMCKRIEKGLPKWIEGDMVQQ